MKHFTRQDAHGEWHVAYQIPGTNWAASVMVGCHRGPIDREVRRLNAIPEWKPALPPAERQLVLGFYDDKDAS